MKTILFSILHYRTGEECLMFYVLHNKSLLQRIFSLTRILYFFVAAAVFWKFLISFSVRKFSCRRTPHEYR